MIKFGGREIDGICIFHINKHVIKKSIASCKKGLVHPSSVKKIVITISRCKGLITKDKKSITTKEITNSATLKATAEK